MHLEKLSRNLSVAAFLPFSMIQMDTGEWPKMVQVRMGKNCSSGSVIRAEVAQTPEVQAKGLGGRAQQLAPDQAMIFVWKTAEPRTFWMKNVLNPLSLFYFGADSKFLSAFEMPVEPDPKNPNRFFSENRNVLVAVEMRGGSTTRLGVGPDSILCVNLDGSAP